MAPPTGRLAPPGTETLASQSVDIWSRKKRSAVMAQIRSTNTGPELSVRRYLYRMGYHYRLHAKELPGRPDIVFRKARRVIFIHGCFWHLHVACRDGRLPKSRVEYWHRKLKNNVRRDKRHVDELRKADWRVLRLWECAIETSPTKTQKLLKNFMHGYRPKQS